MKTKIVKKSDKQKNVVLSKKKKKKRKVTKKNVDDSSGLKPSAFYIVPWRHSVDWNNVCKSFIDGKYEDVIKQLCVWRERVPSLPVGAESTIYLLQAIIAERQNKSDDEARSLYSLAVVRYLNHISHLATKEMKEGAPVPLSQLVSHLNVPGWIVELRHDISHGTTLPSLETLHEAADFIKTWLTENYWVDPTSSIEDTSSNIKILTNTTENKESKEEKYVKMCNIVSAFIASKIYRLRARKVITDPEVTQALVNQPRSVKPKIAIGIFKTNIANFFTTDPNLLCTALVKEMIPEENFIRDFCSVFNLETDDEHAFFEKYYEVWSPLIEFVQQRGRLRQMCTLLGKEHIGEGSSKTVKLFTALWLDNLLEKMSQEEKIFPFRLKSLLFTVITDPNEFTNRFLPRLLDLLKEYLGVDKIQKLETLFNIWMNEISSTERTKRSHKNTTNELFSVDDLPFPFAPMGQNSQQGQSCSFSFSNETTQQVDWDIDYRDSNFWRKVPLGGEI